MKITNNCPLGTCLGTAILFYFFYFLVLAPLSAHAIVHERIWEPALPNPLSACTSSNPGGGLGRAGILTRLEARYDDESQEFTWDTNFIPCEGRVPNSYYLVISPGPNPKNHPGQFAWIYFDATNPTDPIVSVYSYNGNNSFASWKDGDGSEAGDQPADRILSSHPDDANANDWLIEASVADEGDGSRRIRLVMDATLVNDHMPVYPDDVEPWEGIRFGQGLDGDENPIITNKLGIWFGPRVVNYNSYCGVDDTHTVCENVVDGQTSAGYLKAVSTTHTGWYDKSNQPSNQLPECVIATEGGTDLGECIQVNIGDTLEATFTGTDTEDDELTVTYSGAPGSAVVTPASGSTLATPVVVDFSYTPTIPESGSVYNFVVNFEDDNHPFAGQSSCSINICVDDCASRDSDDDGVNDCNDLCPGGDDSLLGQECDGDDSDGCKTGVVECLPNGGGLTCTDGPEFDDADFDGVPDCEDQCQGGDDQWLGMFCDSVVDADQCATGEYVCDNDDDGGDFGVNQDFLALADGPIGLVCSDDDAFDDADGDGVSDCEDICEFGDDSLLGTPCDGSDADECLTGEFVCDEFGGILCTDDSAFDDDNMNGVADCEETDPNECFGLCVDSNPGLDEDGDGVTNCQELADQTDPCDSGSFNDRLPQRACTEVNFFLNQVNIATVKNHDEEDQDGTVIYYDLFGTERGRQVIWIKANGKVDVVVNDLGALPDTYGTVCYESEFNTPGAWSGQVITYKPRFADNGALVLGDDGTPVMDFALIYPFTAPRQNSVVVPLNTNSLGTQATGAIVANWVRLTDATQGDGLGLNGVLSWYDLEGNLVSQSAVQLPDGGRFDFSGHDNLGQSRVGAAEFTPASATDQFYITTSRYIYEGTTFAVPNHYTAYTIPVKPLSGAELNGQISTKTGDLSIAEIVNGTAGEVSASFSVMDQDGSTFSVDTLGIGSKASVHVIVANNSLSARNKSAADGSLMLNAVQPSTLSAVTLIYSFDDNSNLLLGYAPPFVESAGPRQFVEFNSFLGHANEFEAVNTTNAQADGIVSVYNPEGMLLDSFAISVAPMQTFRRLLEVPADTYGVVAVETADTGLVIRNNVVRVGQYIIPFAGVAASN